MTTFNTCAGLESNKPVEDDTRALKIKRLKAKLINEEHRLVLMKKIRQSQTRPAVPQQQLQQQQQQQQQQHHYQQLLQASNHLHQQQSPLTAASGNQLKKLRPPHQMGLQNQLNPNKNDYTSPASSSAPSPLLATSTAASGNNLAQLNQTPAHAHQRPKVNTLWNIPQQARQPTPVGIAPPHVGNLSRQPITTPPNVVQAMMGLTGQQSLLLNQINPAAAAAAAAAAVVGGSGASSRRPQPPQSHQQSPLFKTKHQTTQQQQAAQNILHGKNRPSFKSSLQKQFEQTLMQQPQTTKHGLQSGLGFPANLSQTNKRSSAGISSPLVGNLSRQPITTPPNVVQDMRGGMSGQQSLLMNANNVTPTSTSRSRNQQITPVQQQSPFNKSQAAQMLLQKRTAAKSAIQKQLEQTLMQLPPKQIQLGIDFIPNANNIEFVYYVGLEACVDYLTNTKNPLDIQPLEKPQECSTCGVDFTPSWSWKRSNPVCENCVSNHVKKSIKNTQSGRIKSVLAKAVKQEQEMDQRIMAEAANVVSTPSPTSSSNSQPHQQHSLLQPSTHQRSSSNSQVWPRVNASPSNVGTNSRTPTTSTASMMAAAAAAAAAAASPASQSVSTNPLAALQPAALASLMQMNPQFNTLASFMTANNPATTTTTNNNNQLAQVAALLMNQLTMNLWKR